MPRSGACISAVHWSALAPPPLWHAATSPGDVPSLIEVVMEARPVARYRTWPSTPLLPSSRVEGCAHVHAVTVSTSRLTPTSPSALVPLPRVKYQKLVKKHSSRARPTNPKGPTTSAW